MFRFIKLELILIVLVVYVNIVAERTKAGSFHELGPPVT